MAIDDNASYELTGYQVKDLAQKIRAKADSSSLASVATSGLYSDLTGAPTIPTVYNGKLTITMNGTNVGEFTANQSTDTTIALTSGSSYTAGNGIDITNGEISVDTSVVATQTDLSSKQDTLTAGTNITISSNTISATDTTYSDFNGATSSTTGAQGLVPAPAAGDEGKFLQGDGTWATVQSGSAYTAGNGISIDANNEISIDDTVVAELADLPGVMIGATSSAPGVGGTVPAPAAGDDGKVLLGNGTWGTADASLVEMSYGESNAWAKFIAAYNAGSIVYCRASSNANPATGSQTRKAFMAYVNNATSPTSVEFQYVRSVGSKTASQPVDQVFVYTLTNANGGTWSVVTRDMAPKLAAGTNTTVSYSSGTYTVSATDTTYSNMTGATSSAAGSSGLVPAPAAGDQNSVLRGDGTWGSAPVTYSTTEQAIGTWIDGKTIYRKVYTGTWNATGAQSVTVETDSSVTNIIATGGWFDDGYAKIPFGQAHWTNAKSGTIATNGASYALVTGSGLNIRLVSVDTVTNKDYEIWVEYTK